MHRIFKLEINRILRTKSTIIIAVLAMLISATIASCSCFVDRSIILNANGKIERVYGIDSIKNKRKIEKPLEGVISPEVFSDVVSKYQAVHNKYGEDIPDAIYVQEIAPISEVL